MRGIAKWLSRDRIAERGGTNLYAYVGNRTLTAFDPYGLACKEGWLSSLRNGLQIAGAFGLGALEGLKNEIVGVTNLATGAFMGLVNLGEQITLTGIDVWDAYTGGDDFQSGLFQWYENQVLQDKSTAQSLWDVMSSLALNLSGYNFGVSIYNSLASGDYETFSQQMGQLAFGSLVTAASLNPGATAALARSASEPVFDVIGHLPRNLAQGRSLTVADEARRFFIQDTLRYPGVGSSWVGRTLQRTFPDVQWQQHHLLIQQNWFRAGSPSQWFPNNRWANWGLQRLGNAGWNLVPLPAPVNNLLGRSPLGTGALATGVYGGIGVGSYYVGKELLSD